MPEVAAVNGGRFLYKPPEGPAVAVIALAVSGPLAVGRVYNHVEKKFIHDLYWIYIVPHGARIGPFFADIPPAQRAMARILKEIGPSFFAQPLSFIRRQRTFGEWLYRTIGKPEDLIGGEWVKT